MCMNQSGLYDQHTPKSQLLNKIKGANLLETPLLLPIASLRKENNRASTIWSTTGH